MQIVRHTDTIGCSKTGELINISEQEITYVLGKPNPTVPGPNIKTNFVWCFNVEDEEKVVRCIIWDFNGSDTRSEWSTYGPSNVFSFLFGSHCVGKNVHTSEQD